MKAHSSGLLFACFRLDQELDFITAQQHELEDMLVTLETDLKTTSLGSAPIQHADQERENT